jgi:hypothetical protein
MSRLLWRDYTATDAVLREVDEIPQKIRRLSVGDGNINLPNSGPLKKVISRP